VAIVNEAFCLPLLAGRKTPLVNASTSPGLRREWIEIVGVAQDGKYFSLAENSESFVYLPLAQGYESAVTLIARGAGDLNLLTAATSE